MRFCEVWIEQCEAAKQIEAEFGTRGTVGSGKPTGNPESSTSAPKRDTGGRGPVTRRLRPPRGR